MIARQTLLLIAFEDALPIAHAEAAVMIGMDDLALPLNDFASRYLKPVVVALGYGDRLDASGRRTEAETCEETYRGQRLRVSFAPDGPCDMQEMVFRLSAA
jgi:hypothetical protein